MEQFGRTDGQIEYQIWPYSIHGASESDLSACTLQHGPLASSYTVERDPVTSPRFCICPTEKQNIMSCEVIFDIRSFKTAMRSLLIE